MGFLRASTIVLGISGCWVVGSDATFRIQSISVRTDIPYKIHLPQPMSQVLASGMRCVYAGPMVSHRTEGSARVRNAKQSESRTHVIISAGKCRNIPKCSPVTACTVHTGTCSHDHVLCRLWCTQYRSRERAGSSTQSIPRAIRSCDAVDRVDSMLVERSTQAAPEQTNVASRRRLVGVGGCAL
eukprot:COSAG02_NODE_2_length_75708_cov_87.013953_27_plen_184_part_00